MDFENNEVQYIIRGYTYFNMILLISYSIPALIVIYFVRFKMDKAFAVNIAIQFISFLTKILICFIVSEKNENSLKKLYLIDIFISFVIDFNLYRFVFDMMTVYMLLKSDGPLEHQKSLAKATRSKRLILAIATIWFLLAFVFYCIRYFSEYNSGEPEYSVEIILQIIKIARLIINMNVMLIFCRIFRFFVKNKILNLEMKGQSLSHCQKAVIFWVILLVLLNFIAQVIKCFIYMIILLIQKKQGLLDTTETYQFAFYSLVNYLNGTSILYLLYCMGKHYKYQVDATSNQMQSRLNYNTQSIQKLFNSKDQPISTPNQRRESKEGPQRLLGAPQRSMETLNVECTGDSDQNSINTYNSLQQRSVSTRAILENCQTPAVGVGGAVTYDNRRDSNKFKSYLVSQVSIMSSTSLNRRKYEKLKQKLFMNL